MVLDSGGQTDGEEVTRGLKAGRLQLHEEEEEKEEEEEEEEEEEGGCMSTQHTYVHMYVCSYTELYINVDTTHCTYVHSCARIIRM